MAVYRKMSLASESLLRLVSDHKKVQNSPLFSSRPGRPFLPSQDFLAPPVFPSPAAYSWVSLLLPAPLLPLRLCHPHMFGALARGKLSLGLSWLPYRSGFQCDFESQRGSYLSGEANNMVVIQEALYSMAYGETISGGQKLRSPCFHTNFPGQRTIEG